MTSLSVAKPLSPNARLRNWSSARLAAVVEAAYVLEMARG
jgi:hypothetical protein